MKINKQYGIPIILLVLFLMPFFTALWSYKSGIMHKAGLVNHGKLMRPAVPISEFNQSKKWQLVYVTSKSCGHACLSALDTLARVRLALGRRLYGLDLCLVMIAPTQLRDASIRRQLADMDIKIKSVNQIPQGLDNTSVWIVNNEGKSILTYQDTTKPKAIYADLKKLSELWAG